MTKTILRIAILVAVTIANIAVAQTDISSDVATASGATQSRTVASKFGDQLSVLDFGAVCDGTTDDSSAITSATSSGDRILVPNNLICNAPSISPSSLAGVLIGPGRIKTSDGNLTAPWRTNLLTAPSSYGTAGSIVSGFNGDMSNVQFSGQMFINGTATLTEPTSGYVIHPETSMFYAAKQNNSGWNNSLSTAAGRTGTASLWLSGHQNGQGDLILSYLTGSVTSTRAGGTYWTGGPALAGYDAQFNGGADAIYLNLSELDCNDMGYDDTCNGQVLNLTRTNATSSIGQPWIGTRVQSVGSQPIDAVSSGSGPSMMAFDAVDETFPDKQLATLTLATGGSGYVNGDSLTLLGGTCASQPTATVTNAVSGVIQSGGFLVTKTGKCSTPPTSPVSVTDNTTPAASGATFASNFDGSAAVAMGAGSAIFLNALQTESHRFPGSAQLGGEKLFYTSSTGVTLNIAGAQAFSFQSNNRADLGISDTVCSGSNFSLVSGGFNEICGAYEAVTGAANYASGKYTSLSGYNAADNGHLNSQVEAYGTFTGARGQNQHERNALSITTSGTSATRLLVEAASTASAANCLNMPAGTGWIVNYRLNGVDRSTAGNFVATTTDGRLYLSRTGSGNVTVASLTAATLLPIGFSSSPSLSFTADNTNQCLNAQITPTSADTTDWSIFLDIDEVQ